MDELSAVWLDPFAVALDVSVVSLSVDVDGGTAVVVDIVDEDVVVVVVDSVVFVVKVGDGVVEDNVEVDVELA